MQFQKEFFVKRQKLSYDYNAKVLNFACKCDLFKVKTLPVKQKIFSNGATNPFVVGLINTKQKG